MLEKLIKLANDMDAKGLTAEADRLDAIISKMAEQNKMSKDELVTFLFGPEAMHVEGNYIETKEPFLQGASQCMFSEQCTFMNSKSKKEIHITDDKGNKYKIFEETPMDPTSKIKIEMMLLN